MDRTGDTRFRIELKPPVDPANLPQYYEKIKGLLRVCRRISLASKPSGSMSGFDMSYNLASYLLDRRNLDILFHLTCHDLNKVNIESRLKLLEKLQIRRVLLVTGDNYTAPQAQRHLFFSNSDELTKCVIGEHRHLFDSIGVAGYPGGKGGEWCDDAAEMRRLELKLSLGVDAIYTQCSFKFEAYDKFRKTLQASPFESVQIVPSVALFANSHDLRTVVELTRVSPSSAVLAEVAHLADTRETAAARYLVQLCARILDSAREPSINLCTFGHFDLALDIINELNGDRRPASLRGGQ